MSKHFACERTKGLDGKRGCLLDVSPCDGVGVKDRLTFDGESEDTEDGKKIDYSGLASAIKTMAVVGE